MFPNVKIVRSFYISHSSWLCVAVWGSAFFMHCTDAAYWLCQKRKNKAVLSLIRLAFSASSYAYLQNLLLHTLHNILCQTNPEHMYNIGLPLNQIQKHRYTAGLTCILNVFVSLCHHQAEKLAPGKQSVEAVDNYDLAKDFWRHTKMC